MSKTRYQLSGALHSSTPIDTLADAIPQAVKTLGYCDHSAYMVSILFSPALSSTDNVHVLPPFVSLWNSADMIALGITL